MNIYTGNYNNCKTANTISISGDKGKSCGYTGNAYPKLAPKLSFWKLWHDNIGILNEEENNIFYMDEYYKSVLKDLNINEVITELSQFGDNIILLCYEESEQFCHRHLVAAWLELNLNTIVSEVLTTPNGEIKIINSNDFMKEKFKKHIKKLTK